MDVDGAVQYYVRRKVDQQQTVGDVDSRPEAEIRRSVPGIRMMLQNKSQTVKQYKLRIVVSTAINRGRVISFY